MSTRPRWLPPKRAKNIQLGDICHTMSAEGERVVKVIERRPWPKGEQFAVADTTTGERLPKWKRAEDLGYKEKPRW